jgi:hypothetical protein
MAIRGPFVIPNLSRMYWHLSGLYTFGRQNWKTNFPGALLRHNRPKRRKRRKIKYDARIRPLGRT